MSKLLSHEKVFLRWGLWKLFCNETSGSDIVKSQAHHLPELLKRLQPKHSSFSLFGLVKLNSVITGFLMKAWKPIRNPVCMWWIHFTYSNYCFWRQINAVKYICCSRNHYYDYFFWSREWVYIMVCPSLPSVSCLNKISVSMNCELLM